MKTSSREDLLEALCILSQEKGEILTVRDLAGYLSRDEQEVSEQLKSLETMGDILMRDGKIECTSAGLEIGHRTMRKHRILECFFTETLGMKPDAASMEACVLEHDISDEAVDRLGTYLTKPPRRGRKAHHHARWQLPSLLDFPEGTTLRITSVRCPGGCRRLADLGIFPGERITLVRKLNNKAVVVKAKGCDIALSSEIAAFIFVEKPE